MREQKNLLEQLKNAQHIAKLGSWEQDSNDEILFCSNEVYNILELDHQDTLTFGQFLDCVHPSDRNKLTISFQTSIEEHTPYHLEHRLLFPDGRVKYVIEHAEHAYDKKNKHIRTIGTVQDVTERMEYEKALEEKNILLEEREQKLLQAQEIAKIGNWTLDVKTMNADWSDEMRQICGIDADVSVGPEFLSKTVIPEDWPQLQASLMATAHNGTPHHMKYRVKHQKDGEIRWVDCRGIRFNDKNGDTKLVGTFQDITEKVYTENEIKKRDNILTAVFQVIPDLLFIMEKDGTIIDYHAQKNSDLYINPKLFLGKRMQDSLPQDIGELFIKNLKSLKEDFTFNIFKYELEMEGEIRHYEARMALLHIDNQVMAIVRDISEQVSYEQKLVFQAGLLQQKKQELESIIQDAPNPMMLHNEDGIVLMINQAWMDSSGYSPEDLPTTDAWVDCAYDDIEIRAKTKALIYALYDIPKKENEGEFTFLNKKRKEITWEFSSAPSGMIDGKRTIISSAMDITERKISEEKENRDKKELLFLYETLQTQVEENKLLLKENKQFIIYMVHQIRTPLSVIMLNSSLIEIETENQVSSYVTQINSAINMLSNSYEDLNYIISNDTIEYKAIKINLTEFLNERIHFFKVIAQANDKSIYTNIVDDVQLTMNDTELERLIDNNLSNAIKHSYDKSEIEIVLEKNHSGIILKFISKGKGIRGIDKIFDKNYTESNSAKRNLGLGLNMVKGICEKRNINYNVFSEDETNIFTYVFNG